jgi:pimeloyl-ACP methyl ester carboxylesterase
LSARSNPALIAGLVVCACHAVRPQPPAAEIKECTPLGPAQPMRCGRLSVLEDRTKASGRSISIAFVIVPATGPRTLPPLYDFAGGPGISATAGADFWAGPGTIHRQHRDVVLIDQRGTGQSAPLDCPEVHLGDPLVAPLDPGAVTACRQRLSAIADLSRYSTAESIADFEAVRAALGHERIDISGLSYGSRLAQEYLRVYPDRVRAVALMGAVSPKEKLPLSFARTAQAVLVQLAGQCAADAACHAAIPDLAADIAAVQRSLETKHTAEPGPFWEALRSQLLTTASQRRLPWLLHQAASGDFAPLLEVLKPKHDDGSNALLLAVECPEDTLRITETERAESRAGVFGDYRLTRQIAACKAWGVPAEDKNERTFVSSKAPVLLLAGSMDYVTPPEWAAQIAAQMPNARVVTIPLLGHFPDGLSNMECYDDLIARFFEAGSAKHLDTACVASMSPPPFNLVT